MELLQWAKNSFGMGCLSIFCLLPVDTVRAGDLLQLNGPEGIVEVRVFESGGQLFCTASCGGVQVLDDSPLGLVVDGVDLGQHVSAVSEAQVTCFDERYPVFGHHATARNCGVEAMLPLEASGTRYALFVRVYDDGMAVRYALPEGAKRVDGERTAWTLPGSVEKVAWTNFSPDYEGVSRVTTMDGIPEKDILAGPVTVKTGSGYLFFSEADCEAFPDMAFMRDGDSFKVCFPASEQGWNLVRLPDESEKILDGHYQGQTVSPWRTVVMAGDLDGLVNSDMITNLCPAPAEDMDFSWVKPGRCLWQWWSSGAPMGWEYYLIDDGWRNWKKDGKDQWALLEDAIAYGDSVGVKTLVWVNSAEMRKAPARRAYLERVKAIGAAGIKIDFIPKATTEIMQWYMGATQDCAELGLLVNFHGSVKPTGLSRTYPHDITREAVRGNEYQIRRFNRVLPQSHYVSLPFTRLLAGAADLTPVTLNPEEIATGGYSWAHEVAQAIVFLSPVLHFSDHYSYYLESPMRDLFEAMPTAWDETRVLSCTEMGEVAAYARRKGKEWWIGVMNGDRPKEVTIPLDFLKRKRKGTLVFDDETRLDGIVREDRKVSPQEVLHVKLRPGGGFVARLR